MKVGESEKRMFVANARTKSKYESKSILKKKRNISKKTFPLPFSNIDLSRSKECVCPPKATFSPRDIFKVKRGGPVLYLLPI